MILMLSYLSEIRSLEDQQSRLMTETELESQTILNSEDIIDDDDDEEESEIRVELPSTTQGCTELTTLGCRPISASQIQNSSVEQKKSTMCRGIISVLKMTF